MKLVGDVDTIIMKKILVYISVVIAIIITIYLTYAMFITTLQELISALFDLKVSVTKLIGDVALVLAMLITAFTVMEKVKFENKRASIFQKIYQISIKDLTISYFLTCSLLGLLYGTSSSYLNAVKMYYSNKVKSDNIALAVTIAINLALFLLLLKLFQGIAKLSKNTEKSLLLNLISEIVGTSLERIEVAAISLFLIIVGYGSFKVSVGVEGKFLSACLFILAVGVLSLYMLILPLQHLPNSKQEKER